jgi:hypothetical protein
MASVLYDVARAAVCFDSPLDNRAALYDPEAGNPLIRFDERDVETEAW